MRTQSALDVEGPKELIVAGEVVTAEELVVTEEVVVAGRLVAAAASAAAFAASLALQGCRVEVMLLRLVSNLSARVVKGMEALI